MFFVALQRPSQGQVFPPGSTGERRKARAVDVTCVPCNFWRPVGDVLLEEEVTSGALSAGDGGPEARVVPEMLRDARSSSRGAVARGGKPDLAPRGHIFRPRDEVHDAGERARAVHDGAGTAHDLDAFDVFQIRTQIVANVRTPEPIVIQRHAVERDQHAIAVSPRAAEAAKADRRIAAV